MNRRDFLKGAVCSPLLVIPFNVETSPSEFPGEINFVTEYFDYDRAIGVAGEIHTGNSLMPLIRTAVLILDEHGFSPAQREEKIRLAKIQICEQFKKKIGCVYGDNLLVGNEVLLKP